MSKIIRDKVLYMTLPELKVYSIKNKIILGAAKTKNDVVEAIITWELANASSIRKPIKRIDVEDLTHVFEDDNLENILEIKDVKKSFGQTSVLKGVNLNIKKGETLAIVGANGAGKTVLMETVSGLTQKDGGSVNFTPGTGHNPQDEIGFQFQETDIPPTTKVKTIINFYKNVYAYRIDEAELVDVIEKFGVTEFMDNKVGKLSGGQKQRLNLLLAIIHRPKLMILDEFITGLDIHSVKSILEYVREVQQKNNATLIIITHQPEEIKMLADRIAIMKEGKIKCIITNDFIEEHWHTHSEFLLEAI